jgi:hypothetical protein
MLMTGESGEAEDDAAQEVLSLLALLVGTQFTCFTRVAML